MSIEIRLFGFKIPISSHEEEELSNEEQIIKEVTYTTKKIIYFLPSVLLTDIPECIKDIKTNKDFETYTNDKDSIVASTLLKTLISEYKFIEELVKKYGKVGYLPIIATNTVSLAFEVGKKIEKNLDIIIASCITAHEIAYTSSSFIANMTKDIINYITEEISEEEYPNYTLEENIIGGTTMLATFAFHAALTYKLLKKYGAKGLIPAAILQTGSLVKTILNETNLFDRKNKSNYKILYQPKKTTEEYNGKNKNIFTAI